MIPYIGDISKADAEVLKLCAYIYGKQDVLEFGCGASTQVLANYIGESKFTSIDTDQSWIDRTIKNLSLLQIEKEVEFLTYDSFQPQAMRPYPVYGFVFDDGADSLRREFGMRIWPYISIGGALALHDTRRPHDFRNALEIIAHYQNEVAAVDFNRSGSNITVIIKKEPEPWENWQITEKRLPWQLGYGEPDMEHIKNQKS